MKLGTLTLNGVVITLGLENGRVIVEGPDQETAEMMEEFAGVMTDEYSVSYGDFATYVLHEFQQSFGGEVQREPQPEDTSDEEIIY